MMVWLLFIWSLTQMLTWANTHNFLFLNLDNVNMRSWCICIFLGVCLTRYCKFFRNFKQRRKLFVSLWLLLMVEISHVKFLGRCFSLFKMEIFILLLCLFQKRCQLWSLPLREAIAKLTWKVSGKSECLSYHRN